ncbi:unnamed protein product [Sphagnum balticum]
MLCGCLPFEDAETSKLYKKILAGSYSVPDHLSADACDFLTGLLETNPDIRLRLDQLREHAWWKLSGEVRGDRGGLVVGYHRIPVDEGVLKQEELQHEEIVVEEVKKETTEAVHKEQVRFKIPPPVDIVHKSYSLKPDMATG